MGREAALCLWLQRWLCAPVPALLLSSAIAAQGAEITVVIAGPKSAPPASGPHTLAVQNPVPGVHYQWAVSSGGGVLLDAGGAPVPTLTGPQVRLRTGADARVEVTCKAKHDATGDTGFAQHQMQVVAPRLLVLQCPDLARPGQGPLVAWVVNPVADSTYRWAIEGGEALGEMDGDSFLFRAGDGKKVTLICHLKTRDNLERETACMIPLDPQAPPPRKGYLNIKASVEKSFQGAAGLHAEVEYPDATTYHYRWHIQGGHLLARTGPRVELTAGHGAETRVCCLAQHRKTGAMEAVEAGIALEPALATPQMVLSDKVFVGQLRTARIVKIGADVGAAFHWSGEGLAAEGPGDKKVPEFRFRALKEGPATLTCTIKNTKTDEVKVCSQTVQVKPAQALIAAAQIRSFTCDPPSPLAPDGKGARLHWTLDAHPQPERLVLREKLTGREWDLNPTDRSWPLPAPVQGRYKFSLTTSRYDQAMDEQSCATAHQEVVVPGVAVLAGDADKVGSGYLREAVPGVTPWTAVTGKAWRAPWLYVSQGQQHTIRRMRAAGGALEEVAGMRGLPRVAREDQDRLCHPGQLVHRNFILPGGQVVDDWLVLQTASNCIQAFTEGKVQATMRVLVGEFPETAAIRKARETQAAGSGAPLDSKAAAPLKAGDEAALLKPTAMAVHAATGHLLVADRGHRAVKLFSPLGDRVRTLVRGVDVGGVAVNSRGDVFYADALHHVVKVLRNPGQGLDLDTPFGQPEVFVGAMDQPGFGSGRRIQEARLRGPMDLLVARDASQRDCLFIADTDNHLIRKVLADPAVQEEVETFAGNEHILKLRKDNRGFQDGAQPDSRFSHPRQLCADDQGNLFVQDQNGAGETPVLRLVSPFGEVTTHGGRHGNTSQRGRADGKGAAAGFDRPTGLAVTAAGAIFVADSGNQCVRRIAPDGTVTVAAGKEDKPSGVPHQDDGSRDSAVFGAMSSLAVDGDGRVLVLEPQLHRLRMVTAKATHPKEPLEVVTIKGELKGDRIAIFPAGAPAGFRYPFVLATPMSDRVDSGRYALMIMRAPSGTPVETVATEVPLQALCADRANRIWAALAPDPARPGILRLMRYEYTVVPDGKAGGLCRESPEWIGTGMKLRLAPKGAKVQLDGRPCEPCGVPRITALATDSHHNLYLADAGNGTIWKVDEDLRTVTLVAGQYPYLGPVGRALQGPLPPMQGLALTPDDDLVITCGNAVLQITRQHAKAPAPWSQSELLLWKAPARKDDRKVAAPVNARLTRLLNPNLERTWRVARSKSEERRVILLGLVRGLEEDLHQAQEGHRLDPTSGRHKKNLEQLPRTLAEGRQELAFATAEAQAKEAGFQYLLLVDQAKVGGLPAQEQAEIIPRTAMAEAESHAKQARFEYLVEERKAQAADPARAAAQVRMAYLRTIQLAREARVERLAAELEAQRQPQAAVQVPEPPQPAAQPSAQASTQAAAQAAPSEPAPEDNDGSFLASIRLQAARKERLRAEQQRLAAQKAAAAGGAESRLGKAKALEARRQAEQLQAAQALRDFEKAQPGLKVLGFLPWTQPKAAPPTD